MTVLYTKINQELRRRKDISPSQKLLLGYLNDFRLNGLICYQTTKELACEIGVSHSTIIRDIEKLIKKQLIKRGSFSETGVTKRQYKNRKATVYIGNDNFNEIKPENDTSIIDNTKKLEIKEGIHTKKESNNISVREERKRLGVILRQLNVNDFELFKENKLPSKLKEKVILEFDENHQINLKSLISSEILCSSSELDTFYNEAIGSSIFKKVMDDDNSKKEILKVIGMDYFQNRVDLTDREQKSIFMKFKIYSKEKRIEFYKKKTLSYNSCHIT